MKFQSKINGRAFTSSASLQLGLPISYFQKMPKDGAKSVLFDLWTYYYIKHSQHDFWPLLKPTDRKIGISLTNQKSVQLLNAFAYEKSIQFPINVPISAIGLGSLYFTVSNLCR